MSEPGAKSKMLDINTKIINQLVLQMSSQADEAMKTGDIERCTALIEDIYAALDALARLTKDKNDTTSAETPPNARIDSPYRHILDLFRQFPALRPRGDALFS